MGLERPKEIGQQQINKMKKETKVWKKETPNSESISQLSVEQDQDPSAVKAFPLFILQYKPL